MHDAAWARGAVGDLEEGVFGDEVGVSEGIENQGDEHNVMLL